MTAQQLSDLRDMLREYRAADGDARHKLEGYIFDAFEAVADELLAMAEREVVGPEGLWL